MLSPITASRFDKLLDETVGRTRPIAGAGCTSDGTEVEVFMKLIDHEKAFPHQTLFLLGWQPPWESGSLSHKRQPPNHHLFTRSLAGQDIELRRLEGAWQAITDERLDKYFAALPQEWVKEDDAARKILDYIGALRNQFPAAVAEIKRVLSS